MATIENLGPTTRESFLRELATMEDATLLAQECMQEGAIHMCGFFLRNGCGETIVAEALASLRMNKQLLREEAIRRGLDPYLFPLDQTGFN